MTTRYKLSRTSSSKEIVNTGWKFVTMAVKTSRNKYKVDFSPINKYKDQIVKPHELGFNRIRKESLKISV